MSLVGVFNKAAKAGLPVKKTAPFYSAVDEALGNLKRPKGTGIEFLTEVMKQPGVKKAEIADRKLEQAFKAKGKMTKEEAQQVLKENPPPKLQERQFTEISDDERENLLRDRIETSGYDSWDEVPSRVIQKWNDEIDADMEKYGDYRTAGGKNYREIILKLPAYRPDPNNYKDKAQYDADMRSFNASGKADYQSTHWKEDPNVLAHMRVQDRKGPNGEKILHVEEIQSDWHQAGRKKGYNTPEIEAKRNELRELSWPYMERNQPIPQELRQQIEALPPIMGGVPDAPFKKNWHELAMKRLLNYAADNGYDSIAITPGAEQAKRFNLRNQIDQIKYIQNQDGTYDLAVRPKGQTRDTMFIGDKSLSGLPADELESVVGQEVSQKILSGEGPQGGDKYRSLTGVDLEVGGEGMKGFYDQILPNYLNTFGKSYGVKVNPLPVDVGGFKVNRDNYPLPYRLESTTSPDIISRFATPEEAWAEAQRRGSLAVHNFPITPEMRESIKQKGLPLYQQVGIPTAGAGAASQMLEPEEEAGLAGGGSVAKLAALAKMKKLKEEMTPRAEAVKSLIARDENRYLADVTPNSLTNESIEQEIQRMAARAKASQPEVKEAKGGVVRMTKNRDAMFMELSNKKLKRK
jgi:hypothetical protein